MDCVRRHYSDRLSARVSRAAGTRRVVEWDAKLSDGLLGRSAEA
jgi:hypothetical protein